MKKAGILILLSAIGCLAQTDNSFYVEQSPDVPVGRKVSPAMLSCNADTESPCLPVLDTSLANYAQGTMPSLCSQCFSMGYQQRNSFTGPSISGGRLTEPLAVGPMTLGQTDGSTTDWRTSGYPVID